MTTSIKLTDTQTTILTQAAYRPAGNIEPLPPAIKGGARTKVIDGLTTRGLIAEQGGKYLLTDAGYSAVGHTRPAPETHYGASQVLLDEVGGEDLTDAEIEASNGVDPEIEAAVATAEATWQDAPKPAARRTRENSKQAQVVAMLKRPEGATVAQIMAATNWQAHTVRGTFAGAFKKKLGLTITSEKPEGGDRIYHAA